MNIMINESHCVNVKNDTQFILIAYRIMKITPRFGELGDLYCTFRSAKIPPFSNFTFPCTQSCFKARYPIKIIMQFSSVFQIIARLLSTRWTSTFSKTLLYWVGSLILEPPSSCNFLWLDACLLWHTPIWYLEMTSSSFGLEWGASQRVTIPTLHEVR